MPKRTFPRALLEEWDLPHGDGTEVLMNEQFDSGRWESIHRLVFRAPDDNLLYETHYSQGLTEYQDTDMWDYRQEIEADRVEPYERVVKDFRKIE